MRLLKLMLVALVVLLVLPGLAGANSLQGRSPADVQRCARTEDAIKEVPAGCYVAEALKDGNLEKKLAETPKTADLAKPALQNVIDAARLGKLSADRDALVKGPKEAEDFAEVCKGDKPENVANCAALVFRLLEYSGVKLVKPAADSASLSGVVTGGKAEHAETPGGVNADIQLVAANALNSDNVLLLNFGFPDGVITLGKAPGDETGLIVTGEAPAARAAGSDIGWGKIINDLTPPAGVTAAKARDIYARMVKAETDGKMELAYTLARAYMVSAPLTGAFTERGLTGREGGLARSDQCLTGGDLVLRGLPFECSKYRSLRAAVATDFQPGFLTFFGNLAGVTCDQLRNRAETAVWAGVRLAAARAYVAGMVVPPGIRQPCLSPYNKDTLLKLAREAKSAELRAEAAGDMLGQFPELPESDRPAAVRGPTVTILSKPRGLQALLCGIDDFNRECRAVDPDEKLLDDANPNIRAAAWLAVGRAWASKSRASNWGQATTGKNEAYKRAGAYAYAYPRGLDQFRTIMEPLARGRETTVEKYPFDGTKAQYRRGLGLSVTELLEKLPEAEAERCANEGKTDELKAACTEALARILVNAKTPVAKLIDDTAKGSAGRSKAAGLALTRVLLSAGTSESDILKIILRYPTSGTKNTEGLEVKEPLTAGLVEAYGRRMAESLK